MLKKILLAIYVVILLVMAASTIIEKSSGTDFVHSAIYGSWWVVALWALLVVAGIAYIVKRKVRHIPTLLLHLSFVVILIGALLTHLSAKQGMIDLRLGTPNDKYVTSDSNGGMAEEKLPFKLQLNKFETQYHSGTDAAADYQSKFTIIDGSEKIPAQVSMNKIYAVVLHSQNLPVFQKPRNYHIYLALAFLSIIMTYFGVNYFLTGTHSYA